jgi:hypothetical protein
VLANPEFLRLLIRARREANAATPDRIANQLYGTNDPVRITVQIDATNVINAVALKGYASNRKPVNESKLAKLAALRAIPV